VTRDDYLFTFGQAKVFGKVIFNLRQGHLPDRAYL
jgi:hypothetical protein